jgi:hypothetical protein
MAKIITFPQFSENLVKFCNASSEEYIRAAPQGIRDFFDLDCALGDEKQWVIFELEAFKKKVTEQSGSRNMNQLYWTDQARILEAYGHITVWRTSDLLKSSIRALNAGDILGPSVIARALLELSSSFLSLSTQISKTFRDAEFPKDTVVACEELEERLLKSIWGSRLKQTPEHLKQTNVLTTIEKLSKLLPKEELFSKYEFLCEVAHPNVVGNLRFWSHLDLENPDGSETVGLARHARGETPDKILSHCYWALGWSAIRSVQSFRKIEAGIKILNTKL